MSGVVLARWGDGAFIVTGWGVLFVFLVAFMASAGWKAGQ